MTKVSILQLAQENRGHLEKWAEKAKAEMTTPEKADDLEEYLQDNLNVSVNATPLKSLGIIQREQYFNAWEYFTNESARDTHFSKKAPYRKVFDDTFVDGRRFKYLALNAGNMGVPHWGSFCIVLEFDYFNSNECVILMHNSLVKQKADKHYYFEENNEQVNIGKLQQELAEKGNARKVACIENYEAIDNDLSYPYVVCNSEQIDFIEFITSQDVELKNNYAIRLKLEAFRKVRQAMRKNLTSPNKAKAAAELDTQTELFNLIHEKSVKVESYEGD